MTGKEKRAEEVVEYTRKEMKMIRDTIGAIPEKDRARGLFVWGPTKLDIAGGDSTGSDILKEAGGVNVAEDIDQEHPIANMEQVINWNPDVIVMWYSQI
ncbi:MAG: ABC transporter substrate-binding protein [Candidatus Contubernalis sp.]|nr:ABC transporter substrate-binding protein [Candidatus Contubernalis sp.]